MRRGSVALPLSGVIDLRVNSCHNGTVLFEDGVNQALKVGGGLRMGAYVAGPDQVKKRLLSQIAPPSVL